MYVYAYEYSDMISIDFLNYLKEELENLIINKLTSTSAYVQLFTINLLIEFNFKIQ